MPYPKVQLLVFERTDTQEGSRSGSKEEDIRSEGEPGWKKVEPRNGFYILAGDVDNERGQFVAAGVGSVDVMNQGYEGVMLSAGYDFGISKISKTAIGELATPVERLGLLGWRWDRMVPFHSLSFGFGGRGVCMDIRPGAEAVLEISWEGLQGEKMVKRVLFKAEVVG